MAAFVLRGRAVSGDTPVQVFVTDEVEEVARGAAADVVEAVGEKRDATVLFALGETPGPLYAQLAERRSLGELDTSAVRAVQLDEYAGVAPDDERAFFHWLERDVLGPLAIPPERTIALRGDAASLDAECERYELAVRDAGGIDVAILGLGVNGHVGFNEPPSDADARTRAVALTAETLEANARYWGDGARVPERGVTAGMRVILAAHKIVLVVTGHQKRAILHRTLEGPIGPNVPASYLRRAPHVHVYADRAAWEGIGAERDL